MLKNAFTYHLKIFGCQMNYADAGIISAALTEKGGNLIEESLEANLVVVFTCGVRAGAEERAISWTKKLSNRHKNSVIVMTGCLSNRGDVKMRLKNEVDLFVPIENWISKEKEIFSLLEKNVDTKPFCTLLSRNSKFFYEIPPQYSSSFQACLPIMTGCDNFCSYCVVPFARGREKSFSPEYTLKQAKILIRKGYKEIFLIGQNVNSYKGIDQKGKTWNFARLLKTLDSLPGKFWVRFISSHPKDVTEEMIRVLSSCKKVSSNLHLPLQSGSTRIIKKMNRHYTKTNYLNLIKKIRKLHPKIVLSTDVIVGFPGETEKDFQDSLDVVKKAGFEMLYALKYSPRPETAAYKFKDDIPAQTKKQRQQVLDQTWKEIAIRKNRRYLGKEITVLVAKIKAKHKSSGKISYRILGKTFENKDVEGIVNNKLKCSLKDLVGKWCTVQVEEAGALALRGKFISIEK